jgi:hypothetical protein
MIPLTVTSRGKQALDESLKSISFRGASVIAAHQYLRAQNKPGYITKTGIPRSDEKEYFELLGKMVIEYYLKNRKK